MEWNFNLLIQEFLKKDMGPLLREGLHGLEKEMLRTDLDGNLAMTPHPAGLGDKLTDPEITTDFSESQIELITPPFPTIEGTVDHLEKLLRFTSSQLHDEWLWPFSMPCRLPENEKDIPIARYGDSEQGQKSEIYRKGLGLRYGRTMQTISGVHYNRSFSMPFWEAMHSLLNPETDLKTFINESYLHLVRNFIRYRWLLVLFCGASPVKDCSYGCKAMSQEQKKALSLRLSRCGYSNPAKINVNYNHFQNYLEDLKEAVKTPYPRYTELGIFRDGEQVQLNDHLLQIGNEYYFPIRLKAPKPNNDMIEALSLHGVEYIEVRLFDINPFEPTGVSISNLYFSDLFLMFCLLNDSPPIDEDGLNAGTENQQEVALHGQDFSIPLMRDGSKVPMKEWADEMLKSMEPLASLADKEASTPRYTQSLQHVREALENPELLPAFRLVKEMQDGKQSFLEYGLKKAEHTTESLRSS